MFSVIIPIYNVKEYLKCCIESVLNQAKNIEILLVDDGSTDGSGEIAQHYAKEYPGTVKYFLKENGGLSDARNYAIPFVTNEYIFFLDSDDYISKDTFEKLRRIISDSNPDLIIFDYINKWNNKEEYVSVFDLPEGQISSKEYLLGNPAAWNKVIKADLYRDNNIIFPKGLWYEDRATTGKYAIVCNNIHYAKEGFYFYRQRENSIMNQLLYNDKMLDIIKSMEIFNRDVPDDLYFEEKEYLSISNLLFQTSLRLLPLNRRKELEQCYNVLINRYPNWKKNKYFKKQSKGYQIISYLISYKLYRLSRFIVMKKMKRGK